MATDYQQPGVTVIQEFTGITPALGLFELPNINVGPAFQVVSQGEAGPYTGSQETYEFPDQIAGSLVDTRPADPTDLISYPVRIFIRGAVVSYGNSSTGSVSIDDLNLFSDTGAFEDTLVGDVIVIASGPNQGTYTVRSVVSNDVVQTNETLASAGTNIDYTIRRNIQATVGDIEIPTSTSGVEVDAEEGITLPPGLSYDHEDLGDVDIVGGTVLVTYRAQRLELSANIRTFRTTAELQEEFGIDQIVPENPLAFAAFLALNNQASSTNVLANNFSYLDDELLSYASAFDILSAEEIYVINVLTQSTPVHTALSAHVTALSEPERKLERVGIVNRRLVEVMSVTDDESDGVLTASTSGGSVNTLDSAASHFLTDGVVPGTYLRITSPTNLAGRYRVAAVTSQTKLVLAEFPQATASGVEFYIDRNLTKDEQAITMGAYAASLGNRRLVVTWPDIVKVPVGPVIREVPGYFLGCSVGALTSALPTQQGLTNYPVAIYTGVVHSSKYFNNSQLNEIAGGGVMIFVQNIPDVTALYIRHQLTSDRSAIKFQEYSITKNVDFIAKFIRNNHQQFPGKYNIVDNAFDDLKTNAQAIVAFLRDSTKRPKIGGVIKSGKLVSATQSEANLDEIIEIWALDIPIPLNKLTIRIFV